MLCYIAERLCCSIASAFSHSLLLAYASMTSLKLTTGAGAMSNLVIRDIPPLYYSLSLASASPQGLSAHSTALLLHRDCKTDSQDTDHSKDWFQMALGCVPRFFLRQPERRTHHASVTRVSHGAVRHAWRPSPDWGSPVRVASQHVLRRGPYQHELQGAL